MVENRPIMTFITHLVLVLGVTSIYVTHDQVEAMTLGDQLLVLNGGYVEQFGTPIELYERPAILFVAGFIGSPSMNFMTAELLGGVATLANGVRIATTSTASVTVGIRPEHMVPDAKGPIKVEVEMLEQLGANTLVHGNLQGTKASFVVSLDGIQTAEAGAVLSFGVSKNAVHLFDTKTGKRIDS